MAAPSPTPGQTLGHFCLIEEIGAGGMGIVYRARDTRLERDVAIKVLNARTLSSDSARKRFRREALLLSRLSHPNIESVYDFHSENGIDYLVMEYIPGVCLNDRLQKGALPEKDVLAVGIQLARGLAAAHTQRILHRDLKPGNLKVTPDNMLKILDFGLAQLLTMPDDETVTETAAVQNPAAGTPAYLSPEQVNGKEPDTRSDIYSAGVVLYELATGSRPFPEHGEMLRWAILLTKPPTPRSVNKDISPGLETAILKCLEKDPKLRYQSASELLEDLKELARGSGRHQPVAAQPRSDWRSRRWMIVGVALVAALVAGIIFRNKVVEWLGRSQPTVQQKIMAVLPIDTVGQDPATGALGLGLIETVTAKLVQASDSDAVQVVSPQDLRDKGVRTAEDARREFGTDLVLESSLQRSGQTIRINCHLVDSRTHRDVASKTIEAGLGDPFGLQDKVVSAALDMLPARISSEQRRKLNVQQDTQPAAYEAYMRGRGYLQAYEKPENIDNAVAEFSQAIKIDPNYALAYAGLGNAYWTQFRRLDKGNELVAKASTNCEKALFLNPELVEGRVCLGNVLNGQGEYEKAVEQFKRAVEANGQSDDALRGLAEAYTNLGNFAAAESTYKKAVAMRPNYWGVYSWLGLFYYTQARYPDAVAMFLKATQLAPDNYQGYTTLGGVYITQGRYQDAIIAFQRSIDLRPSSEAYNNLGYTYFLMHRFSESITAQEQAVRLNEGHWEIWGNLGDALYWSPQRRGEAAEKYHKAIAIGVSKVQVNPRDAVILAYLANYSAMVEDRRAALDYLKRALEVAPSDGEVLFRAAVVYNHFNQTDLALSYLKKAADAGYSRAIIKDSPDFEALQQNPQFKALVGNSMK
jgi:eukaryotic-like serine/threonine-protein kinase